MKVAIVTDTHFGVRSESKVFMDQAQRFFLEQFWPYVSEHGIKRVFHGGDLVDRRKYVNFVTSKAIRESFIAPSIQHDVIIDIIAGNHDVYFNNTLEVNALEELLHGYSNINVITQPTDVVVDNVKFLFLPWICQDNEKQTMEMVQNTDAIYCLGHLEFKGFDYYRGVQADHGRDTDGFEKFHRVCTGHYHTQSKKGNIHYLGAPYEMVWSDYDDPRGFWIFDTETHDFEFVQNHDRMHHKVHLEDDELGYEPGAYKDKVVKLIVPKNADQKKLEQLITSLESESPTNIQVVDDHLNMDALSEVEMIEEVGDTLKLLRDCVEAVADEEDREDLTQLLTELYNEAQTTRA